MTGPAQIAQSQRRCLFSLCVLFAAILQAEAAFAQLTVGKITGLNGDSSISRAGRNFSAAYLAPVDLGDQIVTSPNGRVTITLTDSSQLELTESATLLISENLLNPNGTRARTILTLLGGLVRSLVRVAAGSSPNYEVHTPNAVASARGTTYETYYTNHETRPGFKNCKEFTDVFDFDGTVLVSSLSNPSSPPVLLHSGQKTTVPCGLEILPASPLGATGSGSGGGGAIGILGLIGAGIIGGYAAAGGFNPGGSGFAGSGPIGAVGVPEIDSGMTRTGLALSVIIFLLLIEHLRARIVLTDKSGRADDSTDDRGIHPRLSTIRLVYLTLLLLLLGLELIVLTPPPDTVVLVEQASRWGRMFSVVLHQIRPAFVTGLLALVFLSWPTLQKQLRQGLAQLAGPVKSILWFTAHLVLVGGLLAAKGFGINHPANCLAAAHLWLWLWVGAALPLFATWTVAALPPRFWIGWFTNSRRAFLAGAMFGAAADLVSGTTEAFWWPLQRLSFGVVVFLLHLFGQTIIVNPGRFIIGTSHFAVQIWASCSGLEGVGLITAYLAMYLWLFRRNLQFPKSLILLPVGAIVTWLMNALRITALILIGSWNPGVGFKGFHSVAGWLFFNVIACGLTWTIWRFGLFTKPNTRPPGGPGSSLVAVYLVPLLAILGVSVITHASSGGFAALYPLRVLAGVGAFWFYRDELASMRWRTPSFAVVLGVIVFLFWIMIVRDDSMSEAHARAVLSALPNAEALAWLLFRLAGAVVVVPLAEEFAFRGYLIRKLIDADFVSVPPTRFTWVSFIGSSVLFGAMHEHWIAATLTGMIFAAAIYRRGTLSDAVLAHATCNGLLSAYVLTTGKWSLWV